ncbi:vancomycin B-type resistance protein VanW [Acidiphilium sp. CAG:727]|nr:vancomycin B-type resistance protein VanW [Acidiphilium sp. CAG:727]
MYEANKLKKRIFPVALSATGFFIFFYAFLMKITVVFAYPLPEFDYALTVYALGKTYEFNYPEIDKNEYGYYIKGLDGIVDGVYSDTLVRAKDADFTADVNAEDPFIFSKESCGRCIDKDKLKADIAYALQNGKRVVTAATTELKPEIKLTELKSRMKLLSIFETNYYSSGAARKNNIALACRLIGYKTILPGREFSFNETVGERTEARGFKSATIITGGRFTDGVGGGVCQVSSTVYACAALADMRITARRNHSLTVGYTSPSFDAMVSDGLSDLRFVNTREYPVTIVADADGNRVRVRIYGKPNGKSYKLESSVSGYIEPKAPEIIETDELSEGESVVKVRPKTGMKSKAWLCVYDGGILVEKRLLSSDVYSALNGVIAVGRDNRGGKTSE